MKKLIFIVVFLTLSASLIFLFTPPNIQHADEIKKEQTDEKNKELTQNEIKEVKYLIEEFGRKLKNVSLLAPEEMVKESVKKNYGNYVSSALLEKWLKNPQSAPGRLTSSPWPERIDVLNVKNLSTSVYEVNGEIIEMTSVEQEKGGFAAKRPITLIVKKFEERWLIDEVTVGTYERYR